MNSIIHKRLAAYGANSAMEEDFALREIIQETALYALWRADFFQVAAFQGGTSLRILHDLPRFSEDLDFILLAPDDAFNWSRYRDTLSAVLAEFGIAAEFIPARNMDRAVRAAVIKDTSIASQLNLSFPRSHPAKKLVVKLEIDTRPPAGSGYGFTSLNFPMNFEVRHQDLTSNFALKIHALLCRPYLKGRDWFDFGWYADQGVTPNLELLRAALVQMGPWEGQGDLQVDSSWLRDTLTTRITELDWTRATEDVAPFLRGPEIHSLKLWSERHFLGKLALIG